MLAKFQCERQDQQQKQLTGWRRVYTGSCSPFNSQSGKPATAVQYASYSLLQHLYYYPGSRCQSNECGYMILLFLARRC